MKIICESILDKLEKTSSPEIHSSRTSCPVPGAWDFCLMVADITQDKERIIRNILDAFTDDYHITYSRECPDIDDVIDGGRLGNISDYDCAIIEFSTTSILNSVKCLFYLFSRTYWMPAFICHNNKWTSSAGNAHGSGSNKEESITNPAIKRSYCQNHYNIE